MNTQKNSMTAEEIEAQLDRKVAEMEEFQRNGNYVDAETTRIQVEQLKKDFEARRLFELEQKQREENSELNRNHQEELNNFDKFWDKKLEDYHADGQRLESDMSKRHQDELRDRREALERQLPTKIKESSELLNLRKMEQHMAKQKK